MAQPAAATVLLVPGLRDHVDAHWQTWLQAQLPGCRSVPPMGRDDLDCARRVDAIEQAVMAIDGPLLLVAHSAGCIMVAHWAQRSPQAAASRVVGALLATPPDFDTPMPAGYPTPAQLQQGGWLPVPRVRLPFPSRVALSRNDPLASADRVRALAADWGSRVTDLGAVGHLNPASGHGPWPAALDLIAQLSA
jgi:hypothetical protein